MPNNQYLIANLLFIFVYFLTYVKHSNAESTDFRCKCLCTDYKKYNISAKVRFYYFHCFNKFFIKFKKEVFCFINCSELYLNKVC